MRAGTRRTGFPPWTVAVRAVSWRTRHALLRPHVAASRPPLNELGLSRHKPSRFFWVTGVDEDFDHH
jgi:hypothetical protein